MGRTAKYATFKRKFRHSLIQVLSLGLIVSTLSVVSVVAPSAAKALVNADCAPTVSNLTATGVASGNDCIITFTAGSGTWTTPLGISTISIVVVGGGGGGGGDGGSGGGGGELRVNASQSVTGNSSASITIGQGGAGGSWLTSSGSSNGTATTISGALTFTANGGTGGGGWTTITGGAGGTGGTGGTGSNGGAGGGGPGNCLAPAPAATVVGSLYFGAVGSNGPSTSVIGSATNYGGGGGGGLGADTLNAAVSPVENGRGRSGGAGGGGRGSNYKFGVGESITTANGASAGQAGTANTGGGGGAGSACSAHQVMAAGIDGYTQRTAGGAGGSGVVIVKFTVPTLATPSTPDLVADSDAGISQTDNYTNIRTPTFTGTATAGSTIQLQIGSGSPIVYSNTGSTCLTNSSGVWSCTTGTLGTFLLSNSFRAISTLNFGTSTTSAALVVTIISGSFSEPGTITRTNGSGTLGAGETASMRFQTSRPIYGFTVDDLTVSGGTISNFVEVNARDFTATFTPSANATGTASISVGANKVADQAGNTHSGSATFTISYNTIPACTPTTLSSGGYTYLAFKTVGNCEYTPPATSIDLLVVAGGGGGASRHAGGGGAGGLINATSVTTNGSAFSITVGAGGAGGAAQTTGGTNASNGESSAVSGGGITTRTAVGGGGGGYGNSAGASGGSGGGGGNGGAGGSPTSLQGNSGTAGLSNNSSYWVGGGGGGAGAAATTSSSAKAGSGGAGLEISWISTAIGSTLGVGATGTTGRAFAGGGGGGTDRSTVAGGSAGTGGGGAGATWTATPSAGTANTGGGGGGSGISGVTSGSLIGGDGGSGVVVVRYANTLTITYDTQSGSAIASGSTTTGGSISTSPGIPTRAGYTFNGWFAASTGGSAITFPYTHNQTANFTLYAQWSQIVNGSMLFGASANSYITIPNSAGLKFGTGAFTIEWWQYQTDTQLYPRVFESLAAGTVREIAVSIESNTFYWWSGGSALCRQDLGTGNKNAWLHFAVSRSGSTTKVFKNGTEICSFADSKDYQPTGVLQIGTEVGLGANTYFGGNITNFHWVKGTALYTANFTRSTTPTVANVNSILLLNAQNQSTFTTDLTGLNTVTNNGNNVAWSTMSPFSISAVATLSALSLSTGTLSPTFASGTASYTASVSNGTSSITVTPTVTQANATIQVKVGVGAYASVTSASASGSLALAVGSNTITVLVTAQNGTTTATYTVTVTRATALSITTPSGTSLQGTYNTAFTSLTISSSGGAGTNSFTATGSLPAGVTLSSAGVISGTPTTAGNFALTVTVTDANGATATTSSFTIAIAKGVSTISITIPSYTYSGSPQGPDSVTKSGSTGSVTYAYAGRGSTTYASSSTKPTNVGTYTVTATLATDSNFASVSATADFAITATTLSVPASLAAATVAGVASAITVTFNAVTGASSYTVQLFNSAGTQLGSDYTSFTSGSRITGLTASTAYLVKVIAVGDGTNYTSSAASSGVSVTTLAAYYLNFGGGTLQRASTTNAVIPTTGNFTIEGWISPTAYDSTTRTVPVIFSQGTGSNRFYIKLNSNGSLIVFQDAGSAEITCSNAAIPLNVWTHIAVVAELVTGTRTLKCYVNGLLQNNSSNAALGSGTIGSGFYVGQYSPNPGPAATTFAGQIDEVKIWNTARTQAEIADNRNVSPLESATGLVAYYSFDATTGTTAIDLKNSANNLTLASTMSWLPLIRTVAYAAGTNGSGTTASQSGTSDRTAAITLKSAADASGITRSGFSISAWNTNAGGTSGTSYDLSASYLGATDLTLYPTWTANVATPTIGTQPTAAAKTVGQTATFTVVASRSDAGVLSYQWQKLISSTWTNITGVASATSASYSFTTTATSDAGDYRVIVTNTLSGATATATSNVVALTMSGALSITTPTSGLSGSVGAAFITLNIISVGGSGTNTFALASGDLPGGLSLSTSGAITGTPTTVGTQAITVRVTDSNTATATTTSFTISITAGAATKVAVTRATVGTQRGAAFSTQPQVTVQDAGGNTVTSSSAVVTATVSAGGTLVGTVTATASSGVATFTGLGVNGTIGTTYTITYTVSGLTVATATVTLTGTTCDGSFTCQIGDTGPGGGIIFYVAPTFFTQGGASGSMCTTNCKYLEAAPTSGTSAWGSTTDSQHIWSGITNTAIGTTARGTAVGSGYGNTLAIVGQSSTASRAATSSLAYRGPNNLSDWFLPSRDEFNQMCKWQKGITGSDLTNLSTVCTGSAMNTGVGAAGFTNAWAYWTSTERDATNGQYQYMSNGSQGMDAKSYNFYVRPVRAFGPAPIVISEAAIAGVTAPVAGATPVTTTTAGTGYTGTVTWASSGGALVGNFGTGAAYTATITLTAAAGYTLTGVTANFFTVTGATPVTHSANTGVITAVFPATTSSNVATLSALTLTTATLSSTFASGTTSYTSSVVNGTTSITVTPTRTQANATITVNGTAVTSGSASGAISLNVGANTITVVVTAQDGSTTATYTVTVTRASSSDANLSAFTISSGTLSPTFAAATTSYTATVTNATTSITVTPTRNQANATITVNGTAVTSGSASGSISLNTGSNTVTVIGTAQDGTTTRSYTLTIKRLGPDTLGSATFIGTQVAWSSNTYFDSFSSQSGVTTTDAVPTNNMVWQVFYAHKAITIPADGISRLGINTYQSGNNSLTWWISKSSSTNTVGSFSTPAQISAQTSYSYSAGGFNQAVANSAASIPANTYFMVGVTAGPYYRSIKSSGNRTATIGGENVVTSINTVFLGPWGSPSGPTNGVPTALGGTLAGYTYGNGGSAEYTQYDGYQSVISIKFKDVSSISTDASLSALVTSTGTLSPTFDSATTSYSAAVSNATTSITVTPTRNNANATIKVNGTTVTSGSASSAISLNVGSNTITVIGTAEDGTTAATYTITVTRQVPTYTVTYNGNSNTGGAIPTDSSSPYVNGASVTVLGNSGTLVRTNYTFNGWNTAAAGTGTAYAATGSATFTMGSANIILYAQWIANAVVTSFSTTSGSATGNLTQIIIAGTGLTSTTSLTIGNVTATIVGTPTSTQVVATIPTSTISGTKDLVLAATYNTVTIANSYESCGTSGNFFVSNNSVIGTHYCVGSVVVPGGITTIGYCAFATAVGGNCGTTKGNLFTTVTLPNSLRTISAYGFLGATMSSIDIPEGVTAIGNSAFYMGSAYSLRIPSTVTSVNTTFYKSNATSITFAPGSGITSMTDVFRQMPNIFSIVLPDSVTTVVGTLNFSGTGFATITMRGVTSLPAGALPSTLTCIVTSTNNAAVNNYSYVGFTTLPLIVTNISSCPQPTITSLSVTSGSFNGSTSTVITGTHLINTTGVTVAGNAAVITAKSTTSVTITTPAGSVGPANVVVTTEAGNVTRSNAFTYTKTLTATLDKNYVGSTAATTTVASNATLSTPTALTRTGFTFLGWSTSSSGSVVTFPYAHGQTDNFTLYAIWSVSVQTITYAAGTGGSGIAPSTPASVNSGSTFTIPANTYSRAGYTFAGWSDGTSVYAAGATYPTTGTVSANVTLTATWTANSLTVTYNSKGGTTVSNGSVNTAASISTAPTAPTRAGYTFSAWSATDGGTVVTFPYAHGQTANFTMYAKWTAVTTNGISYNNQSATTSQVGGSTTYTTDAAIATIPTTAPLRVGYTFAGWFTESSAGIQVTNGTHTPASPFGAITLYAQWTANSLTVTYNSKGGTTVSNGSVNTAASISTAPTAPTRTGYTFSAWSATDGGTAITFPYAHSQTANFTLYAIWAANALTVTYDSQGGSAVTAGSVNTAASISTAPTAPTKTGYTLSGWSATDGGTVVTFPFAHGQTSNFTLYARWTLKVYVVAFNANNGTGTMGSQSFTHGVATSLNANLYSRANYVFHSWATAANGTGSTYTNFAQAALTTETTLYAQWTANTYVVTFNYNGGNGGDSTATDSYITLGTAITLPVPTKTGFTFAGWHSDAALVTPIGSGGGSGSYRPTGATLSLNAYAKWTAINYTFTYNSNFADSGNVPTETTKQISQTATVKANTGALALGGYTFSGWNTASDGTGTNYLSGSLFTVGSSNVTLYANWSANTYTVTYNTNGGTGNAQRSSTNVTSDTYTTGGSSVVFPGAGTLERTGFTFGGWNTSAAGTGSNYSATNTYTTVSNVIFYAKWNPVTYTITYNGNTSNGGTEPTAGGYTTGQASPYVVLANTFTKTSNVFGGWNTSANGTGTNYSPSAAITTLTNIILYATWIPQFTLHYAINGGTVTSGSLPSDTLHNAGTSVGPIFGSVSRTGYTFAGWANGSATILGGSNFTILEDSVLTAKWNPINYAISYNSDGGTEAPATSTRQIGQSFTVEAAVSKPGYIFTGWSNGSTVVGADAVVVMGSANIAHTAQWVARVYTVSYDWNGGRGTAVADINYTFGTTAITLPLVGDRVKDGYTFAGWSESTVGSLLSATYIPSRSRTLYALWTLGNFTVTYNLSGGILANASVAVQNGSATVLPLPTRANFVFAGWHTATAGGSSVGSNGTSFIPTASQTVYARWIQSSLFGIVDSLTRIGSVFTVANVGNTFSGANSSSSVAVSVPANALPAGTTINFDMVGNSSRATGLLPNVTYLISIAISWIAGDGTVPDTAAGNPILVTISNASIKTGATAYAIVNNVSTLLGTATQDGTITIELTSDPEIVIAAVKPSAPLNVAATTNGNQQSIISWSAPASNGGSEITGYTVTSNTNATCTTSTTSCTISGLANGTTYTFTVTAANTVGISVASSSASATTAGVYAVTFNAKGGTTVASGSFLTAATVSEPTAPTRSGYTFAGWSATDGGSAVTFSYAPGVTTAITMYALWDALNNAVTFNSKSGSSVSSSTFASGGSVAAPTAPTRTGYTFAGWSATDGGTAVTFPYTPGVVTDITLHARWTAVVTGGTPTPTPIPAIPMAAAVVVIGAKEAKISIAGTFTPISATNPKPAGVKIDELSVKFIEDLKVVDGKLVLTPKTGFSGKKIVTLTITEDGTNRSIQVPLTVLPETVIKPILTPSSASRSIIRWTASPNASAYTVYSSGKKVCSTTTTSCSVAKVFGPSATIEVVSNGGESTVSQRVEADFSQSAPLLVTRLVGATNIKTSLSVVDRKALDNVIALIKTQGFRSIVISKISTTKKTESLATARIVAIKKYINDGAGVKNLTFEVIPASSRTILNNILVKS